MDSILHLSARHIQDHNEANTTLKSYWGYADRVLPCSSGKGTCEYLDAVYWMHSVSMLYTWIMWGVLLGIAVVWVVIRGWRMGGPDYRRNSWFDKEMDMLEYAKRRWLLKDAPARWLFGRVTRVQVLTLAVMLGYLLVFSLVGIVYQTWVTPIKGTNLYNTRTGLGGWSDRLGALAYALTPFSVLLAQRESILSLVTGIPYQHFNFLHRWLGYIIFVQAFLHTLGWTLVEGYFYKPQPTQFGDWIKQMYAIFGVVAMFILTLMLVLSTKTCIRWFGYEAFKISHWFLAVLYVAACWGHWDRLWCWMVAALALICLDQLVRWFRTLYIHYGGKTNGGGFKCAQASITLLGSPDDLVARLDFDYEHKEPWYAGQHFSLTFPGLSIWQSHPFTPSSLPRLDRRMQHHTYLIRVRKGQTAELASLANSGAPISTIMTGPYGRPYPSFGFQNVLTVAGGTGVTFTLPIVLEGLRQQPKPRYALDFVWVVRKAQDLLWLKEEMTTLKFALGEHQNLRIKLFVTRETQTSVVQISEKAVEKGTAESFSSTGSELKDLLHEEERFSVAFLGDQHPSTADVFDDFVERARNVGGAMEVLGSGPESMSSDLRSEISRMKDRESIDFYWDSR
ncbi:hypothetical protein D0864_08014 [Hortaea werneckii]|uniref:ferric-chelate reductase (NADPH) n=1 Tax=Hortaea werneckii TaxID=91943 RepID=A0A3M7F1D7_HORWE|nr:hypothetical protein KC323_g1099 [Hortaea werneckii]KAI7350411.1 hypothetical protein KC320_g5517 [Hortaea werneckii]RMY52610.1 hypothetical protein D0863_14209 [Hortaea werneckii]RMY77128.1 hypothetical protein D0862_13617 [Hortaea werneckii]RMY82622.1 hypothetical protein D0864_08014 [Hortaea werneckii]